MSVLVPSQAPGRRCIVENKSSFRLPLIGSVVLEPKGCVDLYTEDPSLTDQQVLDSMTLVSGVLYQESSINFNLRIIDFDSEDVVIPDIIYGHQNRIIFKRSVADGVAGAGAAAGSALPAEVWVDPANGSDTNAGTQVSPYKTLQKAVNDLIPLNRLRRLTQNVTVHVMHTGPGVQEFTDRVVVPNFDPGAYALHIQAEEKVLYSGLVQSGADAAIAGFKAHRTLTLSTSPMTPSELADNAFLRPQDLAHLSKIDTQSIPVVNNATGSLTIAKGLGAFAGVGDTKVHDIVQPQLKWRVDDNENGISLDVNGKVRVIGFTLSTDAPYDTAAISLGKGGDATLYFIRCKVENFLRATASLHFRGSGIVFTVPSNASMVIEAATTLNGARVLFTGSPDFLIQPPEDGAARARLVGVSAEQISGSGGAIQFNDIRQASIIDTDIRDAYYRINGGDAIGMPGVISFNRCSFEGAGANPCIDLEDSTVELDASCIGSTGNSDVAVNIGRRGTLLIDSGTPTVTGTNGNVQVGNLATTNSYGDAPKTDLSEGDNSLVAMMQSV